MLAPPGSPAGQTLRLLYPATPRAFFVACVRDAIDDILEACPEALRHCDVAIEEIPDPEECWDDRVPLTGEIPANGGRPPRVIVYRRPAELRAAGRDQLRRLVFTLVVEQVALTTGLDIDLLDPQHHRFDPFD
ncbi:MAG: metallopeptidase family protein [Propionibacteriaceae bacterium]|jgi:hypothetical protein|nr:metallopeptidase family protein [Propionibacteriaceae bacterium]